MDKAGDEMKQEPSTFFLPCECKPGTALFSVLDPFAYDIKPAYIHGTLGIMNYKPISYAIIDLYPDADPLMGYVCTITHKDTVTLLDKIKGYNGPDAFNFHVRVMADVYTDVNDKSTAWCYVLSDHVLDSYESIEQVEFGMWADDKKQEELLEKLGIDDD